MFTENKLLQNASSVLSFTPAVACRLCLTPVKCVLIWYSLKVDKTATQLHCRFVGGASHVVCSAICDRSTCKSFRAPPFTLSLLLYNSVYYNYIIIMQRLVGWLVLGSRQKGGLRRQKSALWPRGIKAIIL